MTRVPGRVSVVIPCYNGARHLREALDSALAQTHGDVEILVADDGSTDDSVAIATSYGTRIRCLRQQNAGPSAARNLALRAASAWDMLKASPCQWPPWVAEITWQSA